MIFMELKEDQSEKLQYDYADYPIYIRRGLLSSYPNYAAPVHWHEDIELILVLSGEMKYNVNGEILVLKKQEGILINARQLHFGFSEEQTECDFICVLLHPLMLCTTPAYERDFVLPVLYHSNAAFVKLAQEVPWQKEILEDIRQMYDLQGDGSAPLKIQALFLNIWIRLYENLPHETHRERQNTDLSILRDMIGFIQKNYTLKISLAEIAASGAVGESKCCKLFAHYIGQTPNRYLIQYRLDQSADLLINTDMTITEIAHAVGFNGSSYYAEAFRKWTGISPTEYRTHTLRSLHKA